MSILRFEIRHKDGRREIANVEGERVLIGNGAHCDIRLPLDQAANEHVAVEVIGGTVRVETKAFDPPATVNGMPFTNVPLPPEVPLLIGTTWIYIGLGDIALDGGPVVQQKKAEETSPLMKVLGLVVLGAGAYMLLGGDDPPLQVAPAEVPALFSATQATCPQTSPQQALVVASDKYDMAEGKRERSPFLPKDGVLAVDLYEVAAACFTVGGDAQRAADAVEAARQLRTAITVDFRARRVRLEHLMAVGDYQLAKNDVNVLTSLTEGKDGTWIAWLSATNQTVKQRTAHR
jgi:hypothetical protein